MFTAEKAAVHDRISDFCQAHGLPQPTLTWSQIPFSGEWGIATSLFQLASQEAKASGAAGGQKINVPQRAAELAEQLAAQLQDTPGFSRIEAVKGYLNLYFSTADFAARVLGAVSQQGNRYGWGEPKQQRVMLEFSQPNTHKAFHVGHLRNMILGASLANILEAAGYEMVRANYIGDYGKDVMKWMWNYSKRHAGEQPPAKDVTRWMGDLYSESSRELEADPNGEAEIRELFSKWEAEDKTVYDLWLLTRQWSLDGFNEIYEQMGIRFDRIYFESEMERLCKPIIDDLIARKIAVDERAEGGTVVVKLDELLGLQEKYRVLVLLRSDGTSLYGAWDLALALTKFKDYDLHQSIYVVDVRQSLHFTQVFKTMELAGYEELMKKVLHLPYEVVNLPGNVIISSREGVVVLLEELIGQATERAAAIVAEKNPELDEATRLTVAQQVGLAAIKYPMLARETTKIATFDWEAALDFNGQAAPYIQYAYVRANSILRRAATAVQAAQPPQHELQPSEVELIELISRLPEAIQRAASEHKTLHITNLTYELAKGFNDFYNQCPVLQAEEPQRSFRLALVAAARQAMANGLALLGIDAPEVM
ncbi:MAG TPA: arginine--tRNA ligase [Anaerolineales bacterium]|nr:arginine--tRNA ligase [Anaerolineales bacterium]HRQ92744.1 arginine--tRNA ligase [Anaerolineales bacterium]